MYFEYMFPWVLFDDGMILGEELFGNCDHCLIRSISSLGMGFEATCQWCHVHNTTYIRHV